jgi:5-methylcytosine-specific restriction endonuclease McrA
VGAGGVGWLGRRKGAAMRRSKWKNIHRTPGSLEGLQGDLRCRGAMLGTLKRTLIALSNGRCHYCGGRVANQAGNQAGNAGGGPNTATLDHKVPVVKGGPTDAVNCVIACRGCNGAKADTLYEEIESITAPRGVCHAERVVKLKDAAVPRKGGW